MQFDFSLTTLLVFILAILPGLPGNQVFCTLIGEDRKDDIWKKLIRFLFFSVFGLIIYSIAAKIFNFPLPTVFVSPLTTKEPSIITNDCYIKMTIAYIGHFIGSLLTGLIAAVIIRLLCRWSPISAYPEAWDSFIRTYTANHWVVITLTNGISYCGIIQESNISVSQNERDIILKEPAIFDEKSKNYITLNYQYLFFKAELIDSIGVIYDPKIDSRITTIGQLIFFKEENEIGKRKTFTKSKPQTGT